MNKRRILSVLAVVALLFALAGCNSCEHQWEAANCKEPKTCRLCGKTEGDPNDEHVWEDATTDAPKTCSVCRLTEGEKIDVDERFTTDACKEVFGTWVGIFDQLGSQIGLGDLTITTKLTITFFNNGDIRITRHPEDIVAFKADLANRLRDMTYQTFEGQGMTKADAEKWSQDTFKKDLATYCAERAAQIEATLEKTEDLVYYVEDGVIYIAEDWDSEMVPSSYELVEGILMLTYSEVGQTVEMARTGTAK